MFGEYSRKESMHARFDKAHASEYRESGDENAFRFHFPILF